MSAVRHAKPGILTRLSRKTAVAPVLSGHIPFETAPGPALPRRNADRESVAAGLRARAALTAQRDIPTTLLPALRAWGTDKPEVPRDYAAEPVMPYWNPGGTVAVDLTGINPGEQWTAPAPPVRRRCAGVSAIWVGQIDYPPLPVLDQRQYAATLRHIGLATGTATGYEADSVWRLALDPGTGATS